MRRHFQIIFVTIVFLLLLISFFLPYVQHEPAVKQYRYDENDTLVEAAPFSPSREYWFGTDRRGEDLFYKVMDGAKYTILIALFVAVVRVIVSLCIGFFMSHVKRKLIFFHHFLMNLQLFPQTIFCFFLLTPFVIYEIRTEQVVTNVQLLYIQIAVFILVALPSLTRLFQQEIQQIWQKDYVQSSFLLGGSKGHVFRTHMIKALSPQIIFQVGEQMVQVLLLMLHLSIFKLFLGGTKIVSGQTHDQFNLYFPYLNEWSNLISYYYVELMIEPRIIMIPVLFYMILLFCMTKIVNGYKELQFEKDCK
ncbi:ABC transporter permease subunit [Bacillus sp. BP-3]|uniref:ABC transporter permease subunit n=1 Tax=Bacillus sp. BP-3 TaxID=3022773 RepID=UPI00232D9567|nr:ABC transporter permease subunit [Bacillus sp. BP-3]MDC2865175.1 ABC transporter permease subunit [Bacillus sp. BP-3]